MLEFNYPQTKYIRTTELTHFGFKPQIISSNWMLLKVEVEIDSQTDKIILENWTKNMGQMAIEISVVNEGTLH